MSQNMTLSGHGMSSPAYIVPILAYFSPRGIAALLPRRLVGRVSRFQLRPPRVGAGSIAVHTTQASDIYAVVTFICLRLIQIATIRSDMKFSKRKRSLRLRTDHVMARPALARLVVRARQRLRAMRKSGGDGAAVYYAEANDIGLGKNIMLEVDRSHGEVAYSSFLKLFALQVYGTSLS